MDKKIGKKILFWGILFAFLLKAGFTLALEIHYPDLNILGQHFAVDDTSTLPEFVCYFFGLATNLALLIAVLVIAFGGIYYLISYGKGKFTSEAKDWIKAGILGLLIVICASLIIYTINPNLTTCKLGILSMINLNPSDSPAPIPPGVDVTVYREIPIGILTEQVLTLGAMCYSSDQEGNPNYVTLSPETTRRFAPPEDMASCYVKLIEGAQKKAQVAAELANKITNLMDECSCQDKITGLSKCNNTCDPKTGCQVSGSCPGGSCTGPCVGSECQQPPNTTDCCPEGVKDKIEHGPIDLSFNIVGGDSKNCPQNGCCTKTLTFKGLDEFRCPNPKNNSPCSGIGNIDVKCAGGICKTNCGWVYDPVTNDDGQQTCVINKQRWEKLNLWQQLTYYKEIINSFQEWTQRSVDQLNLARSTLGKCYLAKPYVDLIKTYTSTDKKAHIVIKEPETFTDGTGKTIDASKYCQGFNYANSSCYKVCSDSCPDTGGNYAGCTDADCILKAYNARPCKSGSYSTFGECISACQTSCLDDTSGNCKDHCSEQYATCSNEYIFCEQQQEENSECILDPKNASKCLFNNQSFANCSKQLTDQGNLRYCINNAYLCKSGSNEYAGYPDCAVPGSKEYSSSFMFTNPDSQKCLKPYDPPKINTACYSKTNTTASCQDLCPETTKCPTSSKCPECPCDKIDQAYKTPVPNKSISGLAEAIASTGSTTTPESNAGSAGYIMTEQEISNVQMVGPLCNTFANNDDPLTFYCQINPPWWNTPANEETTDSKPKGNSYKIDLGEGEVPIGQTIDNAINWVSMLGQNINKMTDNIQVMLDQMKKIGEAKNSDHIEKDYCKCNAKFDKENGGGPICKTGCLYSQQQIDMPICEPLSDTAGNTPTDSISPPAENESLPNPHDRP